VNTEQFTRAVARPASFMASIVHLKF